MASLDDFDLSALTPEERSRVTLGKDADGNPVPILDGQPYEVLPEIPIVRPGTKVDETVKVADPNSKATGADVSDGGKQGPTGDGGPIKVVPPPSDAQANGGGSSSDQPDKGGPDGTEAQSQVDTGIGHALALAGGADIEPADTTAMKEIGTGAVKSFVQGVPQLYGLAGGLVDYSMSKLQGGDKSFSEHLFRPGGADAVKQEAEDFKQDYIQDNPGATLGDFQHAYDAHRATPDYYRFLADQMRPGISQGMHNAMDVNEIAGIDKTPNEQSALDQAAETIGGAIVPMGDMGTIGKMASNITNGVLRGATKSAAKVASLALPGASSPMSAAVQAGTGLGISAALQQPAEARTKPQQYDPSQITLSPGMTDPRNGQPVTSTAKLSDPVEMAHQNASPSPSSVVGTPSPTPSGPVQLGHLPNQNGSVAPKAPVSTVPSIQSDQTPQNNGPIVIPQGIDQAPQGATSGIPGLVGGGLAAIGGAALALKGAKYGKSVIQRLRGDLPVNVDVHAGQTSRWGVPVAPAQARDDKINASTIVRGNLVPNTNGTLPQRVAKAFSNAINKDTYAEAEAREVGGNPLERIIQSQLGTTLSKDAKAQSIGKAFTHGMLPNGVAMRVTPKDFIDVSAGLEQSQRDAFTRLMQDQNILQRREQAWNLLMNEQADLKDIIANSNSSQARTQAAQDLLEVQNRINRHRAGQPDSRMTFTQVQTDVLRRNIAEARQDPQVRDLERMYKTINQDLTEYLRDTGVISNAQASSYTRDAGHMPLFEFKDVKILQSSGETNIDPRNVAEVVASPERAVDPWSAMTFNLRSSINRGTTNVGTTRIINAFRAADPNEARVRPVDQTGHGTVTVYNNGEPEHYQFARPDVANAIKAQPLDMPVLLKMLSKIRTMRQQFITGPLAGTLYTPIRSVTFDAFATQASMQPGRIFGLAGSLVNRVSPQSVELARRISAVDPTVALTTIHGGAAAALAHLYQNVGEAVRSAAVTNSPLWRAVGQLPGGQQFLSNMGARMAHAYDSSAIHVLEQHNGIQMHQMVRDTLAVRNELERAMRGTQNAGRSYNSTARARLDPLEGELKNLYQSYAGAINLIHNASRYGYWLQNYAALQRNAAREGRQVTEQEVKTLAEEVRRSAGDLAGQPGHRITQTLAAAINYENISAQTARHVAKAMIRDPMQVGLTVGALGTSAYLSYRSIVDRGPEAENWYWNRANPWERIGAIRNIPKPETIAYMAQHGGNLPPWNPHDPHGDHYDIQMSPEFTPFVTAYLAGLEAVGLVKRPGTGVSDVKSDLGFSLADALAVGTIPAVNVPLIMSTGQALNLTAGASGRATMQGPQTGQGAGVRGGQTPGGLPFSVPMLANEVFGLAGTMAYQAVDQGLNAYHQGHSLGDSLQRASLEAEEYLKERPAIPDIPLLYNAPAKVYRTTPAMQRAMANYTFVAGQKSPLATQWSYEFGKKKPYDPEAKTMEHVMDPEILDMLSFVHNNYARKGDIKDEHADIGQYRRLSSQLDRDKPRYKLEDIQSGKYRQDQQNIRLEMQAAGDRTLAAEEKFKSDLTNKFGDRFKKEGLPISLESVQTLVKKYSRPLMPGEVPLSLRGTSPQSYYQR